MKRSSLLVCLVLNLLFAVGGATRETYARENVLTVPASPPTVPHVLNFNGALYNLADKPISGPVDVTFSLYTQESGGTALWSETQTVEADAQGHYNVLLGIMTPQGVPLELFTLGVAHWLGVMVQGLPEEPRVLLVSVPYAMKAGDAETLGGRPASAYQLKPACSSDSASANCISSTDQTFSSADPATLRNAATSTRKAMGRSTEPRKGPLSNRLTVVTARNFIPMFGDNSGALDNSVMYQFGISIGVGTSDPTMGGQTSSRLTIAQADDHAALAIGDPSGIPRFALNPNSNGSWTMYDYAAGGWRAGITQAAGRVGVGTVSPDATLEVKGTAQFDGSINLVSVPAAQPSEVALGNAYISGAGSGIILRSPDGSLCRLFSIDNTGALLAMTIPCP